MIGDDVISSDVCLWVSHPVMSAPARCNVLTARVLFAMEAYITGLLLFSSFTSINAPLLISTLIILTSPLWAARWSAVHPPGWPSIQPIVKFASTPDFMHNFTIFRAPRNTNAWNGVHPSTACEKTSRAYSRLCFTNCFPASLRLSSSRRKSAKSVHASLWISASLLIERHLTMGAMTSGWDWRKGTSLETENTLNIEFLANYRNMLNIEYSS